MNRKRKRLYRTIGFAILFIAIGFIVNDQLRKAGNRISGEYLQELITKESKGLYQLEFEAIDLNILRKSVSIKNIELYATPENREDSINARNLYEAEVNVVNISLESVIRIYTNKELVVDGIEVIDPLVFMTKINPEKEPLKFGRETGELYEVISEYLDLLQINFLKVRSGTVDHSPSNFRLKAINFNVENFEVSQNQKKKKIFYSEAINLGVNQQSILLPDSIHELSFEGFELSTKDSILNFNNFKINARKDIDARKVFQQENQNVYDIDIPTLELKGINYLKAYEDNFLVVEQVNIPKPKIKIQSVLKSKKQNTEQAENSIGASLLALFDFIQIKDFKIQEGGLNLTLRGDNEQRFLSDNISIDLFNIELDSTQRDIQNIIHYFKHASVEINDYDYLLPDNLHNIKFKKLNFNTIDSTMLVQNLEIKPSRSLDDSTLTQFNLNLPVLKMEGIAHRDIYDNDRIDLKNLELRNAIISITPPFIKNDSLPSSIITPEKLYKILGQNFYEIKLKKFSVLNSDLNVGELFSGKSLNVRSELLQIDSTLKSWHLIADSTLINGQELNYKLDKGAVNVSTFQSENNLHSLDVTQLNLRYENLGDQIKVEYLSFKGIQLDSILNQKKFHIDSLTLFKPQIEINYKDLKQQTAQNNEWEFSDKPINILLKEGNLNYQLDQNRNLNIANFDVELNYQEELKLFQLYAQDLILKDEKLKHVISLSKLMLPKNEDNLSIKELTIKPKHKNDSLSLFIKVPTVNFTKVNKNALLKDGKFEADGMLARISSLKYSGTEKLNQYFKFETETETKSKFQISIHHAKFDLANSQITLIKKNNEKKHINSSNTSLQLHNFNLPQTQNQNLIIAEDFSLSNRDFTYYTAKNDTVSVENLEYSSADQAGEIENITFRGADKSTFFQMDKIRLKSAELNEFLKNNTINIEELSSEKTTFNFDIKNKSQSKFSEIIKLPFKGIKINHFYAHDINMKVFHQKRNRDFYVRKANLTINALDLNNSFNPTEIHHHLKSLVFRGKNYRENYGQHYSVFAEDYAFHYPESKFEAYNIKMRSKYDRFEYSKHIEFQNDWFKLDIFSLDLEQINIDSLLISQKFILNKLAIEKGDFTIFRDLNVPHKEDRIVPMPQQILAKLNFPFSVDSVFVNSDIHIHIVPKEASGIGTMTLNVDSGYIFNMRTHHFEKQSPITLEAK